MWKRLPSISLTNLGKELGKELGKALRKPLESLLGTPAQQRRRRAQDAYGTLALSAPADVDDDPLLVRADLHTDPAAYSWWFSKNNYIDTLKSLAYFLRHIDFEDDLQLVLGIDNPFDDTPRDGLEAVAHPAFNAAEVLPRYADAVGPSSIEARSAQRAVDLFRTEVRWNDGKSWPLWLTAPRFVAAAETVAPSPQ